MSQFSFSQRLSFGQYIHADSTIHRLDPRARILMFTLLVIALTFARSLYAVTAGVLSVLALYWLAKAPFKLLLKTLTSAIPLLAFIAFFQLFRFTADSANPLLLEVFRWQITLSGIWAALLVILRFAALIMVINLAGMTLATSEIIYGMQYLLRPLAWLKLPADDLVMILQITLRFFPLLTHSMEQIAKAQAARGAEWGAGEKNLFTRARRILPMLVPMFLTSLQQAERMALAMDARAYGYQQKRGAYHQFQFKAKDTTALVLTAILAIILLWL
jgi:energy-coupling factor transport system permease protein